MCPRDLLFRKKGIMSVDQFKVLVDESSRRAVSEAHLHGFGEPLLDKHLCEKISYAKAKSIRRTFLITNASLLTETLAEELIRSGLDSVKVSFYGESKAEYERIQKGLDYEQAMANVRGLIRAKTKLGRPEFDIRVQVMAGHTDKDFLAYLQKHVVLSSMNLHNWAYAETPKPKAPGTFHRCDKIFRPIMQILWNGDAVPCCLDFDGKIILGNVFQTSISEV
jgi:molybdenum cofactor biosynthesis enzyme MoaA